MEQHVETRHRHRVARVLPAKQTSAGCSQRGRQHQPLLQQHCVTHSRRNWQSSAAANKHRHALQESKHTTATAISESRSAADASLSASTAQHGMPRTTPGTIPANWQCRAPDTFGGCTKPHTPKAAQIHTHNRGCTNPHPF
jgi:hypothetical protein